MGKVKVGVLGAFRGESMIQYCKEADNAELVAICDNVPSALEAQKLKAEEEGLTITCYENYEDFLNHDMDAVVLANYATEHAPFAIKALKKGFHVFSEVLPAQNLKEAIELIEAVEETKKIYAFGENFCYMPGPYEMKNLYQEGKIGDFEYADCEYIHNCESLWHVFTRGDKNHWRNNMYATFYCTHSIGPIIHITGLKPVSVVGFEGTKVERQLRSGAKGGAFGIEMITLENGGIIKSIHGELYKNSIWYSMYGSKGRMETARKDTGDDYLSNIYVNTDAYSGGYGAAEKLNYHVVREFDDIACKFGHAKSDFYSMYHFIEKVKGNPEADTIDVYEAMDMFLPGLFAYFSILDGGVPKEIPDLRDKKVREIWRNNTACTDPKVAGDMLLPVFSKGNPDIPDKVYDIMKDKCEAEFAKKTKNMSNMDLFKIK